MINDTNCTLYIDVNATDINDYFKFLVSECVLGYYLVHCTL